MSEDNIRAFETSRPAEPDDLDLTLTAVSDDELRRRMAEGDRRAMSELARRGTALAEAA